MTPSHCIEGGHPLEDWVEDRMGSDESVYFWLNQIQCDASNFLETFSDDARVPPGMVEAIAAVAAFRITVAAGQEGERA